MNIYYNRSLDKCVCFCPLRKTCHMCINVTITPLQRAHRHPYTSSSIITRHNFPSRAYEKPVCCMRCVVQPGLCTLRSGRKSLPYSLRSIHVCEKASLDWISRVFFPDLYLVLLPQYTSLKKTSARSFCTERSAHLQPNLSLCALRIDTVSR